MKVMGSAMLIFEALVLGLVMPVAMVQSEHSHGAIIGLASALMLLCLLAVGGIRRDRRTAIATGSIVQVAVLAAGIAISQFMVPAVLFGLIWLLVVKLSAKTDVVRTVE